MEYPKIDYLYQGYPTEQKGELHGNGFTYSGRLVDEDCEWSQPNFKGSFATGEVCNEDVGFTAPLVTYKPRSSVDVTDLRSVDVLRSGFAASKRRSFPRISFADSEKMKSTDDEITEKIKDKFFDLIVYGKVGPDEGPEGSLSGFPLWEHVFPRYSRDEIVCLYGGDECIDLTSDNDYRRHIYLVVQYATCFVRELRI